jgi:hypothetical protein
MLNRKRRPFTCSVSGQNLTKLNRVGTLEHWSPTHTVVLDADGFDGWECTTRSEWSQGMRLDALNLMVVVLGAGTTGMSPETGTCDRRTVFSDGRSKKRGNGMGKRLKISSTSP